MYISLTKAFISNSKSILSLSFACTYFNFNQYPMFLSFVLPGKLVLSIEITIRKSIQCKLNYKGTLVAIWLVVSELTNINKNQYLNHTCKVIDYIDNCWHNIKISYLNISYKKYIRNASYLASKSFNGNGYFNQFDKIATL